MKHLKKFNEDISNSQMNSIEKSFKLAKISPKEKLPINIIFDLLFIKCDQIIQNDGDSGKFLTVDLTYSSYITLHETLEDAISCLDDEKFDPDEVTNSIVNLLEYNDINYQEIENILFDYGIRVENIWGLPSYIHN